MAETMTASGMVTSRAASSAAKVYCWPRAEKLQTGLWFESPNSLSEFPRLPSDLGVNGGHSEEGMRSLCLMALVRRHETNSRTTISDRSPWYGLLNRIRHCSTG